jgi:hypothetical protein
MREQAREDRNLPHRRFIHRPQHRGALAEQHVDLAVHQLLQSRPEIGDFDGLSLDLERIELSREPALRRRAGGDCKGGLLDELCGRGATPDRPLRRRVAEGLAQRRCRIRTHCGTDAASEDWDGERNLLPAVQRGAGRYAQQVDAARLHLAQAVIGRDLYPVDHEIRTPQLRPDLLGDLLAKRHRVAFGRPGFAAIGERA